MKSSPQNPAGSVQSLAPNPHSAERPQQTEERRSATVQAHPNIALVKYWGKREASLNLPMTGSISLTLAPMLTRTTVSFEPGLTEDRVWLNGAPADEKTVQGVSKQLARIRTRAGVPLHARVETVNDFPTAAGLASSASGYAALTMAAAEALELRWSRQELSVLARQGSGSACRSLHGGFVEWKEGQELDGSDSCAIPLAPSVFWPLAVLVAVIEAGPKPVSSREAMQRTVKTSPFYGGWIERVNEDLPIMRQAIARRDLEQVGTLAERNCLSMFATMLGAAPPVQYWRPGSVAAMQTVQQLRAAGTGAWFTMDAGPNVKVMCLPGDMPAVREALCQTPGVTQVLEGFVGGPAERIS